MTCETNGKRKYRKYKVVIKKIPNSTQFLYKDISALKTPFYN